MENHLQFARDNCCPPQAHHPNPLQLQSRSTSADNCTRTLPHLNLVSSQLRCVKSFAKPRLLPGIRFGRCHLAPVKGGLPIFQAAVICHHPGLRPTADPASRKHRTASEVTLLLRCPFSQVRGHPVFNDCRPGVNRHRGTRRRRRQRNRPPTRSLERRVRIQILHSDVDGSSSGACVTAAHTFFAIPFIVTVLVQFVPESGAPIIPRCGSGIRVSFFWRARRRPVAPQQRRHGKPDRNLRGRLGSTVENSERHIHVDN